MKNEFIFHALWKCKISKACWKNSPLFDISWPRSLSSFEALICSKESFENFIVMSWSVWQEANYKEIMSRASQSDFLIEANWVWVISYTEHFLFFNLRGHVMYQVCSVSNILDDTHESPQKGRHN